MIATCKPLKILLAKYRKPLRLVFKLTELLFSMLDVPFHFDPKSLIRMCYPFHGSARSNVSTHSNKKF